MKLKTGDLAPNFQIADLHGAVQTLGGDSKRLTLLSFYRHAGCPACNLRVRQLMLASQKLNHHGLRVLAVFESTVEHLRKDLAHADIPFPIIPDRKRRLYKKYGVKTSFGGFVSSFFLRPQYSMKAIFKHGYIPKFAEATTMMPADFLIAPDGTIKLAYYGKNIGDHLSLDALYKALDEISSRNAMDVSMSAIRRFSREVVNSINELTVNNDIYDRLALLILREGYQGVFITREDKEGNLSGHAFKGSPDALIKSKLIQVPEDSSAPIWESRKAECDIYGCVATATKPESMSQAEFEKNHPFDQGVKAFLDFAITNYINYAEGDVSIIAFNKQEGIRKFDVDVINTVVNTARSVTQLIDLAIGNNRMLSALEVAEEVQQNLLPKNIPVIRGLDIAAKSINVPQSPDGKLNVIVGDVSGHGIAAGLLMATARAIIRSRAAQPGSLSDIVTEVNRNLTLDIYETVRFITLFYLMVDQANHLLKWVRAGHDAALLYDPGSKDFEDLYGSGMALGLDDVTLVIIKIVGG
jgi:peroxiredoxin